MTNVSDDIRGAEIRVDEEIHLLVEVLGLDLMHITFVLRLVCVLTWSDDQLSLSRIIVIEW